MDTSSSSLEITDELQELFPLNEPVIRIWADEDSTYIQTNKRLLRITEMELYAEVGLH